MNDCLYKHFKGNYYFVTGSATLEEDLDEIIIYIRADFDPESKTVKIDTNPGEKRWARRKSTFLTEINGTPRFQKIKYNFVVDLDKET